MVFQLTKVIYLFSRALFSREGIKDIEDDDLVSPLAKSYQPKIQFPGSTKSSGSFKLVAHKMEETKEEVKQESRLINSGDSSEYEYYEEVDTPEPPASFEQQRDSIKQDVMK